MKIQLLVDHKTRDLKANVLVAAYLAERGASVILTPTVEMETEIFSHDADHVVFNYMRSNNEHLIEKTLKSGKVASVLDTEGGFFIKLVNENNIPNFIKTFPATNKISQKISNYFVWGTDVLDFLKTTNYFTQSNLKLTGTPRTDLIYRSMLVREQLNLSEGYFLINTSFTLANPKYQTPEKEARDLIEKYNYDEEMTYAVLDLQKEILSEYVELTIKIAQKFTDTKIIFRPHPFENAHNYVKYFDKYKNVFISNTEPIDQALSKAIAIVHYQCSTAMEAMLMGIPALSLTKGADIRSIETINNLTDYHESHDSLINALSLSLSNSYQIPKEKLEYLKNVIDKTYFRFDNCSCQRVGEFLLSTPLFSPSFKEKIMCRLLLFKSISKYLIKSFAKMHNTDDSKFFSPGDVFEYLRVFEKNNIIVTKIGNSVKMEINK